MAGEEPAAGRQLVWPVGVATFTALFALLRGLAAAGERRPRAHILRAQEWLRSVRMGRRMGESCASYDKTDLYCRQSTPSQTAWHSGTGRRRGPNSLSVQHGIEYLWKLSGRTAPDEEFVGPVFRESSI
jgi:hypothetical protein